MTILTLLSLLFPCIAVLYAVYIKGKVRGFEEAEKIVKESTKKENGKSHEDTINTSK